MAAAPLGPPPAVLATSTRLATTMVDPSQLSRISRFSTGEPYFGRSGHGRFDAPDCETGNAAYGTCYLGLSLHVAFAESLLHDEEPVNGEFELSLDELNRHFVHRFIGLPLRLLSLTTGAPLKRMAGHADLAGTVDYSLTQRWGQAVFDNPLKFDGFVYISRHLNTEGAVVLFDRAASNIKHVAPSTALPLASGFPDTAVHLGITIV